MGLEVAHRWGEILKALYGKGAVAKGVVDPSRYDVKIFIWQFGEY